MLSHRVLFVALGLCAVQACRTAPTRFEDLEPPRAEARPRVLEAHGELRVDDYYWLNQREDPDVLAYLEAENAYGRAVMAPTEALQDELYEEMVAREVQDDATVPVRDGGHWYYTRFEEGLSYPLHCRRSGSLDAPEEVLLDVNALAKGHGYYSIGSRAPSPDHTKLAYGVDEVGRRIYRVEVKDLASGVISDRIEGTAGNLVWAEDGVHLFYAKRDPETLRTYQIWRHALGSDPATDTLVFEEADEEFSCSISKTRSKQLLVITSSQTLSTEARILPADRPTGEWRIVEPRRPNHEYRVDHGVLAGEERLVIRTNDAAPNFRLVSAPLDSPGSVSWRELVPHRPDVLLESEDLFARYLVLRQRRGGLTRLEVVPIGAGAAPESHEVAFDDPAYSVSVGPNPEFDTDTLRLTYSSLTTPDSVFDYDLATRERTLLKRDEIRGGFAPEDYVCERIHATAEDGTRVPISLVYRAPLERDGARPLLLYGYGSYGASTDARFSPNIVSLLDRDFVYAIAHVRGGQELGRSWYEDGKLLKKKNTFSDFIACAEHLVGEGYTSRNRLTAMGGSAGGLLMGAVVNMRPDLFRAIVAAVPFVDVVTTMLDSSIPLTTFEWDEWGDPRERVYYDYMLSYSPYDQVDAKRYPDILVTTGLHDSQVQYFEPAKWVAKLRANKTDSNRLVFKCEMEAGHGGRSGRYDRYREQALVYAFLLSAVEDAGEPAFLLSPVEDAREAAVPE